MFDQAKQDIYWVRDQYLIEMSDPDYPEFIDKFGASRGLTRFPHEETAFWQDRVTKAYKWYTEKVGRIETLYEFFERQGVECDDESKISATIYEQKDPDKPANLSTMGWSEIGIQFNLSEYNEAKLSYAQSIVYEFKRAIAQPVWSFYNKKEVSFNETPGKKTRITLKAETKGVFIFDSGRTFDSGWVFNEADSMPPEGSLTRRTIHQIKLVYETSNANILDSGRTLDSGWSLDEADSLAPEGFLIIRTV